jgi:hypothetical protein
MDLENSIGVKPAGRKRMTAECLIVRRTEHMRRWQLEVDASHGHAFGFWRYRCYIVAIPSGVGFRNEISK